MIEKFKISEKEFENSLKGSIEWISAKFSLQEKDLKHNMKLKNISFILAQKHLKN